MQVDIHSKNLELNPPLRTFIEEKMGDIGRLVGSMDPAYAKVEIGIPSKHHQSGPIYYAEVNLNIGNGAHLLRAEATNYDMHAAIVDIKDDLKVQIGKLKDKLREKERQPSEE